MSCSSAGAQRQRILAIEASLLLRYESLLDAGAFFVPYLSPV